MIIFIIILILIIAGVLFFLDARDKIVGIFGSSEDVSEGDDGETELPSEEDMPINEDSEIGTEELSLDLEELEE